MREFRVEPLPDGRFAVVSREGDQRHVGTLDECAEWLDRWEATRPSTGSPIPKSNAAQRTDLNSN